MCTWLTQQRDGKVPFPLKRLGARVREVVKFSLSKATTLLILKAGGNENLDHTNQLRTNATGDLWEVLLVGGKVGSLGGAGVVTSCYEKAPSRGANRDVGAQRGRSRLRSATISKDRGAHRADLRKRNPLFALFRSKYRSVQKGERRKKEKRSEARGRRGNLQKKTIPGDTLKLRSSDLPRSYYSRGRSD